MGGTYFAADRAFIVCERNGFSGEVNVFDLETLGLLKSIELLGPDKADSIYRVIPGSGGATGEYIWVAGHTGGDPSTEALSGPLAALTLINAHTLEIEEQIIVGQANPSGVFTYNKKLYIQNKNTDEYREIKQRALITAEFNKKIVINFQSLPYFAALYGDVYNGSLYNYHNTYGWSSNPWAVITQIDLDKNTESTLWYEEENNANKVLSLSVSDMEVIGDELILLSLLPPGLVRFDPKTGATSHLLEISGITSALLWVDKEISNE